MLPPWTHKLLNLLSATWLWLRRTRRLTEWTALGAVVILLICWLFGYHHGSEAAAVQAVADADDGEATSQVLPAFLAYLRLGAMLGSIVGLVQVCRVYPDVRRMMPVAWGLFGYLALWAVIGELQDHSSMGAMGAMGQPTSPFFYGIKVLLLAVCVASPPLMIRWYLDQITLDRYTLKNFLQPLGFCLIAFASLWVLIDLIDNMRDFQEANIHLGTLVGFYLGLLPHIYVLAMPAGLMLAVLYALTRMSRANEIISMLTAGRSLSQVLKPVFVVSGYACFLSLVANYHWAPLGEAKRTALLQSSSDKKAASIAQVSVMHHHEATHRTWFVGSMPFDPKRDSIGQLEVRQLDEKGRIVTGWYGARARWWPDGTWFIYNGMKVNYEKGVAVSQEVFPRTPQGGSRLSMRDWSETPWTITSGSLSPDNLGVPDLVAFLSANALERGEKLNAFRTHLAQRFALPWQALVLVFMAAPLGVSFSRRGALGGIAGAVFIFFGLMFLNNLFLNLGKSGRLPSWLTVWGPHLIIGVAAWLVFRVRAQNKDLPKFTPVQWLAQASQWLAQMRAARQVASSR